VFTLVNTPAVVANSRLPENQAVAGVIGSCCFGTRIAICNERGASLRRLDDNNQ
jgi:hypothetical protein